MERISIELRTARQRMGLTLREVEERCNVLAEKWGHVGYKISASWLDRVEREHRGLSAAKMIVLAYIYNLTMDQMLALCPGMGESPAQLDQVAKPNTTLLLGETNRPGMEIGAGRGLNSRGANEGPLEQHARLWLPEKLVTDAPPEDTTLLKPDSGVLPNHYRRGIIGRRDKLMEPMLPPGSIVLIDTQKRSIASRKEWNTEFDRPIYFLFTRAGYLCSFCELDKAQEWLQVVPHMLSTEPRGSRWRYRKEIEVIGTVTGMFTRRAA